MSADDSDTTPYASKGIGGHHAPYKGRTDEWLTPRSLVEALGPFDLDPCAPLVRPWPTAALHYTEGDDGLALPWTGSVWLNPPYGPQTGKWLARGADQGNTLALVFARTETDAFFRHVWERADALYFLRGRLTFCTVDGKPAQHNSGGPSVLVAYGQTMADRLRAFSLHPGQLVTLRQPL